MNFKPGDRVLYHPDRHRSLPGVVRRVTMHRIMVVCDGSDFPHFVKDTSLTLINTAPPPKTRTVCNKCLTPKRDTSQEHPGICECGGYLDDVPDVSPEENPREKGDDDGVEYGDPRDHRDGKE